MELTTARKSGTASSRPLSPSVEAAGRGGGPDDERPGRRPILGDVRTRVLVSLLALLLVSTAASLIVLRSVLLSRTGNQAEETLTSQVNSLRAIADSGVDPATGAPFNGSLTAIFDSFLESERPLADGMLVTFANGQRIEVASDLAPGSSLEERLNSFSALTSPQSGELETADGPARYVAVPIQAGEDAGVLVAAKLLSPDRDQVEDAIRIALGVSVVVMLLSSLFIWLAASRAMVPLHALARTTRQITETDLSGRVTVRGSDELAELGRTFNGMLERLETAFADQKSFLADVGHELRTPITVIRGHLETLGDDPVERAEGTAVIQDELERMSRLVDDLLLLARAGRPDFLRPEPLDLDLLTQELYTKARALGDRPWTLETVGVGLILADPHRLTSAVMNLAQNAVRHTRPQDAIAIGSSLAADEARIWVRDEGVGIDPAEQVRIFERFEFGGSDSGGAGLGLAIVRAIVEAHGGRVELLSAPGEGSTFSIVFPVEPPAAPAA